MFKEFKEFAMRGNVVDMAVGIIIGTSFGKIVTSLVNDVIMPPIGFLLGKVDFSNLSLVLHQKTVDSAAVAVNYGIFINRVIDFLIVSFTLFLVIKQINRFSEKKEADKKECPFCCSSISIKAVKCPDCTADLK